MIEKIVSGGQTGVDQAGLLVATERGIPIGGWCPKGRLDESGNCILDKYPLREATTSNPDERTKLNIRDSDGTLILVPSWPLPEKIKDGTKLTYEDAERQNKPYLIIDLSNSQDAAIKILKWIKDKKIKVLNVAGPRESNSPGIYESACELFRRFFPSLKPRPRL